MCSNKKRVDPYNGRKKLLIVPRQNDDLTFLDKTGIISNYIKRFIIGLGSSNDFNSELARMSTM
jgi:hypothetical protein